MSTITCVSDSQGSLISVLVVSQTKHIHRTRKVKVKGNVLPYSLPSVGPGADPGVQAVSSQVSY